MSAESFERGARLTWILTMLGFLVWLIVYAVQEFRPAF